jgi:hypothetical protein
MACSICDRSPCPTPDECAKFKPSYFRRLDSERRERARAARVDDEEMMYRPRLTWPRAAAASEAARQRALRGLGRAPKKTKGGSAGR